MPESLDVHTWPAHLRPGAVRFARSSRRYDETIAFYRDLVGLPVIGEFHASFGEDGTIFGFPSNELQLEIVRAHDGSVEGTFDQLVLYLDSPTAVGEATKSLRDAGMKRSEPHPYWAANGAVVFRDPDGRDVVFAPWVYGRDPEPVDAAQHAVAVAEPAPAFVVEWYAGDRAALRHLFLEAEDSDTQLDGYINAGRILVARRGDAVVGHLQLVDVDDSAIEVKNMAVSPAIRGTGIGRLLVETALAEAARSGKSRVLVATATADIGNLRFYQRCGFRLSSIERDVFTAQAGYPESVVIDGIPLADRVWLEQPTSLA